MSDLPAVLPTPAPASTPPPKPATPRLVVVDYLRGIAALLVCFCHFQRALPSLVQPYFIEVGKTGVQIFFVISGFIIPYGLHRSGYNLTRLPTFYIKRFLRLHPPYLTALCLLVVLSVGASLAKHETVAWTLPLFLKTSIFQSVPPENPVYWTLIVELKYYVFISLFFWAFFSHRWLGALAIAAGAAGIHFFHLEHGILQHATYFLVGFCACRLTLGISNRSEFAVLLLVALAGGFSSSKSSELTAGAVTALLLVLAPRFESRLLAYFGAISYSLYLVHFPVGVKLINLLEPRVASPLLKPLLVLVALGLSVVAAEVVFRLAERPAIRWSQNYKGRRAAKVA